MRMRQHEQHVRASIGVEIVQDRIDAECLIRNPVLNPLQKVDSVNHAASRVGVREGFSRTRAGLRTFSG
jgi:hypothetical protein